MTDTVSQCLAGPETLSTWPEMLGGVCGFRQELCVLLEGLSQELEVPRAGLCTGRGVAGTPRSPKEPGGGPGCRMPCSERGSLILPDMEASGPGRLCSLCPANHHGRWRSARVP